MDLKMGKYVEHSIHIEKLNKWLVENHTPCDQEELHGCSGKGVCNCDSFQNDDRNWVVEVNGKEVKKLSYYDKYEVQDLIDEIEDLLEEEKERILDQENIRVYACSVCGEWSVDGDDV